MKRWLIAGGAALAGIPLLGFIAVFAVLILGGAAAGSAMIAGAGGSDAGMSNVSTTGDDDYPWATQLTEAQGGTLSPLGYYYRECVDYVAYKIDQAAGTSTAPFRWTWSTLTPLGGDAAAWEESWVSRGWQVSSVPQPGTVAWWAAGPGMSLGHVAWVNIVNSNGTVTVSEYNWGSKHSFDVRTISVSAPSGYLYPPAGGWASK